MFSRVVVYWLPRNVFDIVPKIPPAELAGAALSFGKSALVTAMILAAVAAGLTSAPEAAFAYDCVTDPAMLVPPPNSTPGINNFACGLGADAGGTFGENSAIGTFASAAGDNSSNTAVGGDGDASGLGANASGQRSNNSAFGADANAQGHDSANTAVGGAADASGGDFNNDGSGSVNVAVGSASNASGLDSFNTAVGPSANAKGDKSSNYAAGSSANASGADLNNDGIGSFNSATGTLSDAHGNDSVNTAYGASSNASGDGSRNTALGTFANASGSNGRNVAVGDGATASGFNTANTAVGAGASAAQANTSAFGAFATTTRANQQMFGTATNSYTMAGINTTSTAAQVGPTRIVTADASGTLGTTTAASLGLASSGDISNLQSQISQLGKRDDELAEGIAISLALAQPFFHGDQTFAVNVGWGGFDGETAFGATAAGIVDKGGLGAGSTVTLYGGIGAGTNNGTVAGKGGVSFGW